MANIDVISADEQTDTAKLDGSLEKNNNALRFADIRTGDPAQSVDTSDIEADAKLEDGPSSDKPKESEAEAKTTDESKPEEPEITEPEANEPAKAEEAAEPEVPATETEEPQAADPEPAKTPEPVTESESQVSDQPPAATVSPKGSKHIGRLIFEMVLVLLVVVLGYWAYGLSQDNDAQLKKIITLQGEVATLNANPAIVAQKESDATILAVSKLTTLPTGESPTIANVSDASAAKKQSAFFVNAQNGDKVLFYVKTGQAILYRPSTNTIIASGPLTINATTAPAKKP